MRPVSLQLLLKPVLFSLSVAYLGFHALHGEHGIYALIRDLHRREALEENYRKTKAERESLEVNVSHLRDGSLDLDLLDEQYRRMMGGMKPGEAVVLLEK